MGTPKTHRRYLARDEGTYGPMPRGTPKGLLGMPFNTTVSLTISYGGQSVASFISILNSLGHAIMETTGYRWSLLCWR